MCIGNRGESSAHYINCQLAALYENAQRCTEKHGCGRKPNASTIEYSTCLAEYYGPGKHNRHQPTRRDLSFYANFGCPRIEFVCNHEVILYLQLQEGHYNLEVNKYTPKQELHEVIENYTIAFRVNFRTHSIDKFRCAPIGNSECYTLDMHILDLDCAVFVPELSHLSCDTSVSDERSSYTKQHKQDALTHYITKYYLQTLKRAGLHVLYCLPDFDNLDVTTACIDYSVISKRTLSIDKLYDISVEEINTYLRGLWLQAASHIDEHGYCHDGSSTDEHFLAELRTTWTESFENINLHMYFGPLQIRALCKREVVLYLDLQDIHVHYGGGYNECADDKVSDWKVAFIVDVCYEESDDCTSKRIKLDIASARYCEHLSVFGECGIDYDKLTSIRTTLVRYITEYYLKIIVTTESTCIFHHDKSIHYREEEFDFDYSGDEDYDNHHHDNSVNINDCTCEDEASCGHSGGIRWGILHKGVTACTKTCDFDLITAVTQGSLNKHFKAIWDLSRSRLHTLGENACTWKSAELEIETCLADYSFVHPEHGEEVFFAASFAPAKIQLLCKEGSYSVIFYLNLVEGYMKTLGDGKCLQPGSHAHPFANWRLAFEIDLKLVEATEESIEKSVLNCHSQKSYSYFQQLVLDFSCAKFNLDLSTVPGLLDGDNCRLIRARRQALVYYIQTCYFPVLQRARHHILYTIPTCSKDDSGSYYHELTSLKFQIIPFNYGQGDCYLEGIVGRHRAIYERNMIVFTGMTCGRPLPTHCLPRGINWACGDGKEIPHGTICLSRKIFLEARILTLFELINRETTIVPCFSGIDCGEWVLELTTWGKHEMKKRRPCQWTEVAGCDGRDNISFEWKNRDDWRYEHEGDYDGNGLYHVKCTTHNVLSIPTTRRGSTAISINGNMELTLSYCGHGKEWDAKMAVTWSAAIMFSSDPCGLKIHVSPAKIVPKFRMIHCNGSPAYSTHEKVFAHLHKVFPDVVEFSSIIEELQTNFEGRWTGLYVNACDLIVSHPHFNKCGDLLLELGVYVPRVHKKPHGSASTNDHAVGRYSRHASYQASNTRELGYEGGKHVVGNPSYKAEVVLQSVTTPPPHYSPSSRLEHGSAKTGLRASVSSASSLEVTDEIAESSTEDEDV